MPEFAVTFELIGVLTIEARDQDDAMMLVNHYGTEELIADSHVKDVFVIDAQRNVTRKVNPQV